MAHRPYLTGGGTFYSMTLRYTEAMSTRTGRTKVARGERRKDKAAVKFSRPCGAVEVRLRRWRRERGSTQKTARHRGNRATKLLSMGESSQRDDPFRPREPSWMTTVVPLAGGTVLSPLGRQTRSQCGVAFDALVLGGGLAREETRSVEVEPNEKLDRTQRKRGRVCKADSCDNYIVHKGLCCRHGGGKRCSVDGCSTSAKYKGLCWKHGGSVACKIDGCKKRAKAKGVCWSHGGGTQCEHTDCTKIAVSGGFCWAHGGGKRCIHDGCQRPSYARTHSFCTKHYNALQGVDYYAV